MPVGLRESGFLLCYENFHLACRVCGRRNADSKQNMLQLLGAAADQALQIIKALIFHPPRRYQRVFECIEKFEG